MVKEETTSATHNLTEVGMDQGLPCWSGVKNPQLLSPHATPGEFVHRSDEIPQDEMRILRAATKTGPNKYF